MSDSAIKKFDGQFRFLSNFYPVTIKHLGMEFNCVESAYQASKCLDPFDCLKFEHLSAFKAKQLGRTVKLRPKWNKERVEVMSQLVRQKFDDPFLKEQLISTYPLELIEGNYWGDTFWGVCKGTGNNNLGKILMAVRDEVRPRGIDFKKLAEDMKKPRVKLPFLVAGTGHRPEKLFTIKPYSKICFNMLVEFCEEVLKKVETDYEPIGGVISGMALGFDQALAMAALNLDKPLIACVPCKEQDSPWPDEARARYRKIMRRASETWYATHGTYTQGCMHERDRMMVHKSDLLIALYDGNYDGGTAYTVNYALRLCARIENVWSLWEENYG
jgi:ribA/ribD-fused uncharacterized protein